MVYCNKEAEMMRVAYRYRRLIRSKKLKVGIKEAKGLVGPDTAYHLYGNRDKKDYKDLE